MVNLSERLPTEPKFMDSPATTSSMARTVRRIPTAPFDRSNNQPDETKREGFAFFLCLSPNPSKEPTTDLTASVGIGGIFRYVARE
jgi:hypothetical protein